MEDFSKVVMMAKGHCRTKPTERSTEFGSLLFDYLVDWVARPELAVGHFKGNSSHSVPVTFFLFRFFFVIVEFLQCFHHALECRGALALE